MGKVRRSEGTRLVGLKVTRMRGTHYGETALARSSLSNLLMEFRWYIKGGFSGYPYGFTGVS